MILSLSAVTSSSASEPCCLVENKNNINNNIVFCGRGNFYRAGFHLACSYGLRSQRESLNHCLFEVLKHYVWIVILGRFRRGSNGNVKKAVGLISKKKNNSARESCYFVLSFFAVPTTTTTWNGQILSVIENGDGNAINSTISVWTCFNAVPSLQLRRKFPSLK